MTAAARSLSGSRTVLPSPPKLAAGAIRGIGGVCVGGGTAAPHPAVGQGGALGSDRKPSSVPLAGDDHLSGTVVADRLEQPTRGSNGAGRTLPPIWPCSDRGLPCPLACTRGGGLLPHRFTLACAVGLRLRARLWPSAVCSLLPCPSPCGAQALPGDLPCGARTFLDSGCPEPRSSRPTRPSK